MSDTSKQNIGLPDSRKSGYLSGEFRIFYNADRQKRSFPFHYHDFHKILLLMEGNISYRIEGVQYDLRPGDIILVNAGELHSPLIHDSSLYERVILYLSRSAFQDERSSGVPLFNCFDESIRTGSHLIRPSAQMLPGLRSLSRELARTSAETDEFGADMLRRCKVLELLIYLNRFLMQEDHALLSSTVSSPVLLDVMSFIREHLTDDALSIDDIASHAGLTRSYLMHLFKKETGTTIGSWLTEKRLFLARSIMHGGASVTDACYQSGFGSYAAFYHAYRKKYGAPPTGKAPVSHSVENE